MALTPLQVAAAAYEASFHGDDVVKAVQLAKVTSGYDPSFQDGNGHYGLFGIKKSAHENLFKDYTWNNPADNARMANIIFQKRTGWDFLHPTGKWSTQDWPQIASPAYAQAKLEATQAWNELKKRLAKGDSPAKILGSTRTDGRGSPESGPIASGIRGAQSVASGLDLPAIFSTLIDPDTWLRVAEVVLGGALVIVGLMRLTNIIDKAAAVTPIGRAVKVLK